MGEEDDRPREGKIVSSFVPRLELTGLAAGLRHTWKRLLDGHCGIVNVNHRDERFKEVPCQIAAVVPKGSRKDGGWTASEWLSRGVSE